MPQVYPQINPTTYLDHSATTAVHPQVLEAMLPYFTDVFGNASSAHFHGRKAQSAIENARERIAEVLNCQPHEVIFTSGGTESDNLAVRGAAWSAYQQGKGNHLITTPVEHGAIGKTIHQLAQLNGFEETILPIDHEGNIDPADFEQACKAGTILASIMYANNEVGTILPIAEFSRIAHEHGVIFHTDAVQAAGQLPLDVQALGVDLLSISGHKFYGPKGIGALYVRDGINLTPAQTGGGQESGLRPGTYNTPLIVGLAEALVLAYQEREARIHHYQILRDELIHGILNQIPNARLTGDAVTRLPSHASFVFEGLEDTSLLDQLSLRGIAASAASACKTGATEPSSVLLALGYSRELAISSLRLTVGIDTTAQDIAYTINTLTELIPSLTRLPVTEAAVLA